MSDTIVARNEGTKFKAHPEGQFISQCVDTINLGEKVEEYPGTPTKVVPKCALVFRTGEKNEDTGEYIDISREFTISMGEKSNLRKFLEQWRGKPYSEDAIKEGVPLHKLTGNHGLLTVARKTSGSGRTYGIISACVGLPKQLADHATAYPDYERAEYWETRKKEYAAAVEAFMNEHSSGRQEAPPASPFDDDDDLPF